MSLLPYRLTAERFGNPAGTIVYKAIRHDYGLANDDTRTTGVYHVSVTLREDGDYPTFTVPAHQIVKVE